MSINLFELATRGAWRFKSLQGNLSVEDLWNLPLKASRANTADLNGVAQELNAQLKTKKEDFVSDVPETDSLTQMKFDLVLSIIQTKKAEAAEARSKAERKAQRDQLLEILSRKENAQLEASSVDELRQKIAELS